MRPVLFEISPVTLLHCLAIFAVVLAGLAAWLLILRARQRYTRDHLVTGLAIAGMAALFLFIIYRAGEFRVNSYGSMLMAGFILAILSCMRLVRRRGMSPERLLDLGLVILVSAIIGARGLYMLLDGNAGAFIDPSTIFSQGIGGLSFHGGFLGALLGSLIYVRVTKLNFWRVADALAPGVAIGYAITRIGCFLNGCCYGQHTELPWAVTLPHSPSGYVAGVHPTQLYAMLMGLAMFGILLFLSRGDSLGRAGRLFMVFLMLEGVERFVMEIFREADPKFHGILTPAQYFSIAIIIVGMIGWYLLPKRAAIDELPAAPDAKSAAPVK